MASRAERLFWKSGRAWTATSAITAMRSGFKAGPTGTQRQKCSRKTDLNTRASEADNVRIFPAMERVPFEMSKYLRRARTESASPFAVNLESQNMNHFLPKCKGSKVSPRIRISGDGLRHNN